MQPIDIALEALPRSLKEVAEVIGLPAALVLARRWGGRRLRVPAEPSTALIMSLGGEAAHLLCQHYRDDVLDVPACTYAWLDQRDEALRADRARGRRISELSIEYGISERQVKHILAGGRRGRRRSA